MKKKKLFPENLKIGAHNYKVKYPYVFDVDNLTGQHCSETKEIRVKGAALTGEPQAKTNQFVCFFHEIFHAIDQTYCMESLGLECSKEALIDSLSEGIVQVLLDNDLYKQK